MRIKTRITNPGEVEIEMIIAMPLADWETIYRSISRDSVPPREFDDAIREMIAKTRQEIGLPETGA
jgi:hypothetical protein